MAVSQTHIAFQIQTRKDENIPSRQSTLMKVSHVSTAVGV